MPETDVFVPFRFRVALFDASQEVRAGGALVCAGAFRELSGLEATHEPKRFAEGGRNWGEHLRSGRTTFATLVLKRGVTTQDDLWRWFDVVTRGGNYAQRLTGRIEVHEPAGGEPLMTVRLARVLPVKFKAPDLSAVADQVAVEELHLGHEGFIVERRDPPTLAQAVLDKVEKLL